MTSNNLQHPMSKVVRIQFPFPTNHVKNRVTPLIDTNKIAHPLDEQ
jgi:hypothetical protein